MGVAHQLSHYSNSFYDLTCIIAGKALTFEEEKTQTILGTLTLTGSDPIILRSTTVGVQWEIDPQGTSGCNQC